MAFSPAQISAFRYWIQGYPKFYEPLVAECFRVLGYQVEETVMVKKVDIERVIVALFDGYKTLGPELDTKKIIEHLRERSRIQPDLLLEKDGKLYLAELKSWGGYRTGKFDLSTARAEFMRPKKENLDNSALFLVDWMDGQPIAGKVLVVSSRSPQHDQVLDLLNRNFNTSIELLYLDELFRAPQLAGTMDKYLAYLDAAVAELKQAFKNNQT